MSPSTFCPTGTYSPSLTDLGNADSGVEVKQKLAEDPPASQEKLGRVLAHIADDSGWHLESALGWHLFVVRDLLPGSAS